MFLLCYSSEGNKSLLNTRNNWGLLAIEIDKLHDRFWASKTLVELVNFTCEWPNSQLDPRLVACLCRLVVIHSMASCAIRHGHKSVASHSWFFFILCKLLPSHTGNSRWSRTGRRSVANQSQSIRGQSEVGRKCISAIGPWLWFWGPIYADSLTNGVRGSRARKSVVVRSQVTLITWSIIHFLFTRMPVAPRHRRKR